jgi:hypothetical protein
MGKQSVGIDGSLKIIDTGRICRKATKNNLLYSRQEVMFASAFAYVDMCVCVPVFASQHDNLTNIKRIFRKFVRL